MKLKQHLMYCSVLILGIVMMVVGLKLTFDYTNLPDSNPYVGGVIFVIGMFGLLPLSWAPEAWIKNYRESKNDYWEIRRKERKKEERRKRSERKASVEKYRKLEEERKEREKKNIPEKIVASYPAEE